MRLFVAAWPSPDAVDVLRNLDRPQASGVRWTRPEQWHVTLRFLGDVAEHAVGDLEAALRTVRAPARSASLGPVTASFGRRILMVPVSGLDDLGAATVAASAAFGEPPDDRPFAGHLTLARGGDVRPFAGTSVSASWTVDEFTLVRSTTHRDGARYDVVARFPLA